VADIHFVRKHKLPLADAKKRVQEAADELGQEYDLQSEWDGDTLLFSRSGVQGAMAVTPNEVTLEVKLGFLLRPFKAKFEHHIERNLELALAAPAAVGSAKGASNARVATGTATKAARSKLTNAKAAKK
jgi:putative polyhydroxyalkanoate system protein